MDLISIIALLVFISCLILGFYILIQDSKNTLNRLFFLLCLCIAAWNLCTIFGYHSKTKEDVEIWLKIGACCVIPFFALGLHFCFFLTQRRKLKSRELIFIYLPALLIWIGIVFRYSLFFDYYFINGHWKFIPAFGSIFFYFLMIYTIVWGLASIILILTYGKNASLRKEKKQAVWMTQTIIATMIIGVSSRYLLPLFHINYIPDIGATFFIIFILGLYYSVFQYKFMVIRPSIVADEIISNISDMVIMLDPEFKITLINNKFFEFFKIKPENPKGRPFMEFIETGGDLKENLDKLLEGTLDKLNCSIVYKNKPENIMTDSYLSRVADKFSDLAGFLVISMENKGKKQLKTIYKITDREFNIIDLIISGFTYKQISKKLSLSEKTVESHLRSVYNKMGINNKIELIKIAYNFNLILKNKFLLSS